MGMFICTAVKIEGVFYDETDPKTQQPRFVGTSHIGHAAVNAPGGNPDRFCRGCRHLGLQRRGVFGRQAFVWVTGDTKPNKDKLKALGFQWHSKKSAWFLAPEDYRKRSRKDYTMDTIRAMYGTSGTMESNGGKTAKIGEAVSA
jgi:hypothetical protein